MVSHLLESLLSGNPLSQQDLSEVFGKMFNGELTETQIAGFLCAWRIHGESGLELAVGGGLMRDRATPVLLPNVTRPLIDNCGTGGDGSHSFNISTASAIVAAACGAKVAKHGNRSVSSKCGSADLFFAAGLSDSLTSAQTATLLASTGLTFFFAPHFHPVMKFVMPVRKSLGVRTIFNLLGPLANPIAPEHQLIGVGDKRYLKPMAEALAQMGTERGLVVHSRDGLDEISPAEKTDAIFIRHGRLEEMVIDPTDYGVVGKLSDLRGGDASHNLRILGDVLAGKKSTILDTVALNAGAVLWLAEIAATLNDGFQHAQQALLAGDAQKYFTNWLAEAKAFT